MTSKVLDLTTIGHALIELSHSFLGNSRWRGFNEQQRNFLLWYADHMAEINTLDSLKALASTDFELLNQFLVANGFEPLFKKFDGIGVASILDMLVEWLEEANLTRISRRESSGPKDCFGRATEEWVYYPAFDLDPKGVDIYDVWGYDNPLLRLHTKTGHSLWLMKADEPASGLDLNYQIQQILTKERKIGDEYYPGVVVPMLEMDLEADMDWILGTEAHSDTFGKWYVQSAFQKFKLRANEKGARVKVATGMVMAMASCGPIAQPYYLDDPFIGFFTQPGHDTLPLAAFWADTDVWKTPAGSLEDL